jgi:hypothetical protein
MIADFGYLSDQYWIRLPLPSDEPPIEIEGIGPDGKVLTMTGVARISWFDGKHLNEYLVCEFANQRVHELRVEKLGENESRETIGTLRVR